MVNVCSFFKVGYCKFANACMNKHVKDLCENQNCEIINCELRHPKLCSYYQRFNYCKFGSYCCYRHEKRVNNHSDKIGALEEIIREKSVLIDVLNIKVEALEIKK